MGRLTIAVTAVKSLFGQASTTIKGLQDENAALKDTLANPPPAGTLPPNTKLVPADAVVLDASDQASLAELETIVGITQPAPTDPPVGG